MTERRVVTCDRCNPTGRLHGTEGRGILEWPRSETAEFGWKTIRDGSGVERHVCSDCQEEEEEKTGKSPE